MRDNPFIRPAVLSDLDAICAFAEEAAPGITSLPRSPAILEKRLQQSQAAFHHREAVQKSETYLFGMECNGELAGISGILSRVGEEEPLYAYHRLPIEQKYAPLKIDRSIDVLHFIRAQKKPTEIGTLFLKKALRKKKWGRLLSFCRFLFIAAFRERFAPIVIAELRGTNDSEGNAPFWDGVGRPFFNCPFKEADYLRMSQPECIEKIFPHHPIYPLLLPQTAQAIVGVPHPETVPAFKLLEKQGFKLSGYLDIFDGGPHVFARTDAIHAIAASKKSVVYVEEAPFEGKKAIVANERLDFRACVAEMIEEENKIILSSSDADVLKVRDGDQIRFLIVNEWV